MWFICKSILCKDVADEGVVQQLDEVGLDILLINKGKCRRCRMEGVLEPFDPDKLDSHKYYIWDVCHECGKWTLICSGTGCCEECDKGGTLNKV